MPWPHLGRTDRDHDAELAQYAAQKIDHRCPLRVESFKNPVQGHRALLLRPNKLLSERFSHGYTAKVASARATGIPLLRKYARLFCELILCTILLSLVAFLAAFAQTYQEFIPIWPSAGIGLGLVWQHGARYWPAIFVSSTILSVIAETPALAATGNGSLEVLIAMTALWLMQRWRVRTSLSDLRQLLTFIAALLIASSLAIPIYALRTHLLFQFPPGQALLFGFYYFLSESFSFLIFTPLIVVWSHQKFPRGRSRVLFLLSLFVLAVVGGGVWSVDPAFQDRFLFSLLPIVVICSLVAGLGGASVAAAAISMLLIAMAQGSATILDTLLRSFFVMSTTLTGYLLAVMLKERERAAKEMEYRAHHDSLTGLLNRAEFEDRANGALEDAGRYALFHLDIDQFRVVNDTCGHAAGDQLLRDVSLLLSSTLREGDVVARWGGDEFVVMLAGHSSESALAVAQALRRVIHDFQFMHEGRSFWLSASIGVVFLEGGADTLEAALADADRACYQAKEQGRNRVHVYASSDREIAVRRADMDWVSRLRAAIEEKRLKLYAQPIVSIANSEVSEAHIELLLRLVDEHGTQVPPMAFIPAAERYGLMPMLDRWVVEEAFSCYAELAAVRRTSIEETWAINLSGATLGDETFPTFLKRQFEVYGLSFDAICFEVTETAAISNLANARRFMREMKSLGCCFALDDFGAGASSFSYLQNLPVDFLKIDASFLTDIMSNPVKDVMVRAINQIGHVMKIKTIAEGVESKEVLSRLGEIGVDFAQGYAIGIPYPLRSN